mgnify:FL=1
MFKGKRSFANHGPSMKMGMPWSNRENMRELIYLNGKNKKSSLNNIDDRRTNNSEPIIEDSQEVPYTVIQETYNTIKRFEKDKEI